MLKLISEQSFFNQNEVVCKRCLGVGEMYDKKCPFCNGTGHVIRQTEGIVRIFKTQEDVKISKT